MEAGEAAERGLYAIPVGGIRGADSESTAVRWFVLAEVSLSEGRRAAYLRAEHVQEYTIKGE